MKVLFATHAPRDPLAAVYNYYTTRAEWMSDAGHSVEVVVPHDLPGTASTKVRWWPIVYARELHARLNGSRDTPSLAVFHSHAGWATAMRKASSLHLRDMCVVIQFHGLEPLYFEAMRREMGKTSRPFPVRTRVLAGVVVPWLLRRGCRHADHVLCLNQRELTFLQRNRWVKPEKVSSLPNHVDEDFFMAPRSRSECRNLLFLGQWQAGKGIRYLVSAFERLAARHPDLLLSCVGGRGSAEEVKMAFSPAVRDRVRVTPSVERTALLEELKASDLFLFPSLSEGFSIALLEAMAAALPIVCTPVGAAPDILVDKVSALFVERESEQSIEDAVETLLYSKSLRENLGAQATRSARAYATRELKPRFVALLERLSEGRSV